MGAYKCAICGRSLTDPESQRIGIGPVCLVRRRERYLKSEQREEFDRYLDYPITRGVRVQRGRDGIVETNVPHLITYHSPGGFEYGYGGSGPSDLALNIVEVFLRRLGFQGSKTTLRAGTEDEAEIFRLSWSLHHDFKQRFIAGIPKQGGDIPHDRIERWLRSNMTRGRQNSLSF